MEMCHLPQTEVRTFIQDLKYPYNLQILTMIVTVTANWDVWHFHSKYIEMSTLLPCFIRDSYRICSILYGKHLTKR